MLKELEESSEEYSTEVNIDYVLTSIFDHTVFDALSKVVQKLFPFVKKI